MKENNSGILGKKIKIKVFNGVNIVGFILIMMAGWIDAIGIKLFLFHSPTFMTGRAAKLGYTAFNLDFKMFPSIIIVILAFILGSCLSTIITRSAGLMGGLIFAGILILISALPVCLKHKSINSVLLPMAMGGQNAATSLTIVNRTTHLTGSATDIGINIAKRNWRMVVFWIMRWIGFPLGSVIALNLANLVGGNLMGLSIILIIPAVVIIATGVLQRIILDIKLLRQ